MGMDAARTSAEPEGKKPASCSEMTRPSGVMRMVMPPGGMWPAATCSARSLVRRALVCSERLGAGGGERRSESCGGRVGDGCGVDVGEGWGLRVGVEGAEGSEGRLHGFGELHLLLLVGLAGGEEDDEEGEEQRDEVGVGDQPALVVDVLGVLFPAHALTSECFAESAGSESKR